MRVATFAFFLFSNIFVASVFCQTTTVSPKLSLGQQALKRLQNALSDDDRDVHQTLRKLHLLGDLNNILVTEVWRPANRQTLIATALSKGANYQKSVAIGLWNLWNPPYTQELGFYTDIETVKLHKWWAQKIFNKHLTGLLPTVESLLKEEFLGLDRMGKINALSLILQLEQGQGEWIKWIERLSEMPENRAVKQILLKGLSVLRWQKNHPGDDQLLRAKRYVGSFYNPEIGPRMPFNVDFENSKHRWRVPIKDYVFISLLEFSMRPHFVANMDSIIDHASKNAIAVSVELKFKKGPNFLTPASSIYALDFLGENHHLMAKEIRYWKNQAKNDFEKRQFIRSLGQNYMLLSKTDSIDWATKYLLSTIGEQMDLLKGIKFRCSCDKGPFQKRRIEAQDLLFEAINSLSKMLDKWPKLAQGPRFKKISRVTDELLFVKNNIHQDKFCQLDKVYLSENAGSACEMERMRGMRLLLLRLRSLVEQGRAAQILLDDLFDHTKLPIAYNHLEDFMSLQIDLAYELGQLFERHLTTREEILDYLFKKMQLIIDTPTRPAGFNQSNPELFNAFEAIFMASKPLYRALNDKVKREILAHWENELDAKGLYQKNLEIVKNLVLKFDKWQPMPTGAKIFSPGHYASHALGLYFLSQAARHLPRAKKMHEHILQKIYEHKEITDVKSFKNFKINRAMAFKRAKEVNHHVYAWPFELLALQGISPHLYEKYKRPINRFRKKVRKALSYYLQNYKSYVKVEGFGSLTQNYLIPLAIEAWGKWGDRVGGATDRRFFRKLTEEITKKSGKLITYGHGYKAAQIGAIPRSIFFQWVAQKKGFIPATDSEKNLNELFKQFDENLAYFLFHAQRGKTAHVKRRKTKLLAKYTNTPHLGAEQVASYYFDANISFIVKALIDSKDKTGLIKRLNMALVKQQLKNGLFSPFSNDDLKNRADLDLLWYKNAFYGVALCELLDFWQSKQSD